MPLASILTQGVVHKSTDEVTLLQGQVLDLQDGRLLEAGRVAPERLMVLGPSVLKRTRPCRQVPTPRIVNDIGD
jgi:hypothetical protein